MSKLVKLLGFTLFFIFYSVYSESLKHRCDKYNATCVASYRTNGTVPNLKLQTECLKEGDFVLSISSPYIQLPEAKRMELQILQNGLAVNWTQALDPENELAFYLLKIVQDGDDESPFTVTEYFLIDVAKTKKAKLQSYLFNWSNVDKHTYRMSATVFALRKTLKNKIRKRKFTFNENSSKTTSSSIKRETLTTQTTDPCLCNSKVFIKSTSDVKTIHGEIETSAAFPGFTVDVQLIDENNNKIKHRNYIIAQNKTIRVKYQQEKYGIYTLRVDRLCPTKCGSVPAVRSHEIHIRPAATDAVIEKMVPAKGKTDFILLIGVFLVTVISVCTLIGVFACAIWCFIDKYDVLGLRSRAIKAAAFLARRKVAVIYTEDTPAHKQDVFHFTNALEKKGIDARLIDESINGGLVTNWVDAGENIADKFHDVIFIVSPQMQDICHKTNYDNSQLHKNDSEDEVVLIENGVLHMLPAVVLNSLKMNIYIRRQKWTPRVYAVYLKSNSSETIVDLERKFSLEHKSLLRSRSFIIEVDVHGYYRGSFNKLIKQLKSSGHFPSHV